MSNGNVIMVHKEESIDPLCAVESFLFQFPHITNCVYGLCDHEV